MLRFKIFNRHLKHTRDEKKKIYRFYFGMRKSFALKKSCDNIWRCLFNDLHIDTNKSIGKKQVKG